jgi:hypothetical protein
MSTVFNTSYKVQVDVDTDTIRNQYNIEEGAYVTTESGVWTVFGGEWVKLYPQSASGQGLGWVRYDDGQYTSENKLTLASGVETTLTNNGANIVRSKAGIDYYNTTTNRLVATTPNDVYLMTVVFNYSANNASQAFMHLNLENAGATPYERLKTDILFPKGNDEMHEFHGVFQYYVDQDFIDNGSSWKVTADGSTCKIWDIIYFIQKTQSYA